MAKAIAGEGSIRKRLNGKLAGKWRVQWAYDDPITTKLVSVDKTFALQGDAAKFLKDVKARVHTGQKVEQANSKRALTLNAWFDDLAGTAENDYSGRWHQDGMKQQTIAVKVSRYNAHVRKSDLGPMPLQQLDVDKARSYFRAMKAAGNPRRRLRTFRAFSSRC